MKKLILMSVFTLLGIIANAQEKIYIGSNNNGDKIYFYPSTIQKHESYLKLWYEIQLSKPQIIQKKYYTRVMGQSLIDCNGIREGYIAITLYGKDGNVVVSTNRSELEAELDLEPQAPGTVGWDKIEKICKYNK